MGKRNPANEMTVEELIGNGLTVSKKFPVVEELKEEYGLLLASIERRFKSSSALRDAELMTTVQYFVPERKGTERGTYEQAEGILEKVDMASERFIVDGIRIKLSQVYKLEVKDFNMFEDDEADSYDDSSSSDEDNEEAEEDGYAEEDGDADDAGEAYDFENDSYDPHGQYYYVTDEDGDTHRLTAAQWRELERIREAQRRQMERDMERMHAKYGRRYSGYTATYATDDSDSSDDFFADDDYGFVPDEEYHEKTVDINDDYDDEEPEKKPQKKKRTPKTIGWLPPEKRQMEPSGKKGSGGKRGKKPTNDGDTADPAQEDNPIQASA